MSYIPNQKILQKYADVLVNFALGKGKGIKKNDIVYLVVPEVAKPLLIEVQKAILKAGGHLLLSYLPDNMSRHTHVDRTFYTFATKEQLTFYPKNYYEALFEEIDHYLAIIAETDLQHLKGIDPEKITLRQRTMGPFLNTRIERAEQGKLSWTLALYGTEGMAKEAKLTEEEYWNQIIQACYLDVKDPVSEWKEISKEMLLFQKKLSDLEIEKVNIKGSDADLWIKLGKNRKWLSGNGENIPSFEIFTTPDFRGTEGWIRFNQPLYYEGNVIEGIELEFHKGKIVKSKAKKGEKTLKSMIATKGADQLGEFSLTDRRHSRITKFMAETLFDENMGGEYGNTHIAIGSSFKEAYKGSSAKLTSSDWKRLGFNESPIHTDIISTTPRTVTAYLPDGSTKVIYVNGEFQI